MATSPEKWEAVKAWFDAALELDSSARSAFLRNNCPDEEARAEVERLLSEHDQAGGFLSTPAMGFSPEADALHPSPKLAEGELLAGRFRILRFIAGGGMGEVYEAEDEELRERVAIKTIRPEILIQPNAVSRFRREVHLARKVTHPNVCRIFDLFRHKPISSGSDQEIVFVSMELLHGPHLGTWLGDKGAMNPEEALPVIRQMVSALAAAHAVGIVHRDFKPQNVVLVPTPDQQQHRVVVTDFGLAVHAESSAEASFSTGPGLLGTLAYMSPEQIEGRQATAASDIYALGLVVYEMVTGDRPFQGDTPMSAAVKRLSEPPIPPQKLKPGISHVWESVILRCLERDPAKRFASVDDVAKALAGENTTQSRVLAPSKELSPRGDPAISLKKKWVGRIAAAALAAVFVAGVVYVRWQHGRPLGRPLTDKDTLVLADFINKTGDAIFSETLNQGLAVELEQSPFLNILGDKKVSEVLGYMGRSANETLTPEIALEVCLRSSSKAMLLGSIRSLGSHYVIGLKAIECQNDDSIGDEQVEADSREQVLAKLHEVGMKMRIKLGETLASIQRFDVPLQRATTSSLEALQAYSRATKAQNFAGDSAAIPLYKHAIELDPSFASAYADLAVLYANLHEFRQSAGNAQKAYELRNRSTEREKFIIDSTYYTYATAEQDKAAQVYEQWKQTYPRDLAPYIQVGVIDTNLGRLESALKNDQEALKLTSQNAIVYGNLAYDYTSLNRLDEATATLGQAKAAGVKDEFLQNYYQLAFLRTDLKEMQRCVTEAMGKPGDEDALLASQSDTEAYHGRLSEARRLSRRAIDSALNADGKEAAAGWHVTAALREAEFGNPVQAEQEASSALALASNRELEVSAALAFARAGSLKRAKSWLERLERSPRGNTLLHVYWLPTIRAAIALRENQPLQAIHELEGTTFSELGGAPPPFTSGATMYPVYLRGEAYLATKRWAKAASEFQKIIDHRGLVWNSPLAALSYLQLARAYGPSGDPKARTAYTDFLALWHDADPDLALLRAAKTEYSSLN
jgi:tetratricopeptide (TPR) repeat protein/tRNA A-37 threonylcarbamoyl transferase component Bud32